MGDPWQSERLMRDALAIAREHGERHPLFATLNNLVAVLIGMYHLLRDAVPIDEAREPLRRALPYARETLAMAEADAEPFFRVFAAGNLGEALLHLGQLHEARTLLDANAALARQIGAGTQAWRIECSQGELALLEGDAETAWALLSRVLAASGGTDAPTTRMRLHHALWQTARMLQRPADALHHLEQYLALERQRALQQLRAQSQLLVTRTEIEQVQAESRRDQLTRLSKRREVDRRWPVLIEAARAAEAPLAVAMLDLDHFKQINDRFGHAVGDSVLVALADILHANTRSADLVARIGGEEFLLVLTDAPAGRALEVCERLRQRVAAHDWQALAPGLAVTLSVGLTTTPPYDAVALTARADAALYRAKAEGRNRVVQG
jgi:diguanylate cyclase (GGDEF)-like protein